MTHIMFGAEKSCTKRLNFGFVQFKAISDDKLFDACRKLIYCHDYKIHVYAYEIKYV